MWGLERGLSIYVVTNGAVVRTNMDFQYDSCVARGRFRPQNAFSRVTNQLTRPERTRTKVMVLKTSITVSRGLSSSFSREATDGADDVSFSPPLDPVLRCRTSDIVTMAAEARDSPC